MLRQSQCGFCKHFLDGVKVLETENTKIVTCKAFTNGIPYGVEDHLEPFPGDNGIMFEPKDEETK
jgi:hypothetical protein